MGQKETKVISLSEAIELAKNQSTDAMIVRNRFQAAYWQYRNFKADLLPNIMLKGTLPSFNRTLSSYLKEDGSQTFISNNSLSEQLSLSISQNIPLTGGLYLPSIRIRESRSIRRRKKDHLYEYSHQYLFKSTPDLFSSVKMG